MNRTDKITEFNLLPPEDRENTQDAGFDLMVLDTDPYTKEGAMTLESKRHQLEIRLVSIKAQFSQGELTSLTEHQADMLVRYCDYMEAMAQKLKHRPAAFKIMEQHFRRQLPLLESRLDAYTQAFHLTSGRIANESIRVLPQPRSVIDVTPQEPRRKGLFVRIFEALFGR